MFDIIAVPVDGSEYGYNAADVAIEIAKKFDSKIAAIHVLEEFSFSNYGESEDNGNKILAKVTKKANDEGIDTVEHLLTADALRDMKFIINQAHADLVVIHALGSDDKRFVSFVGGEGQFVCLYSPTSLYARLQNEILSFSEKEYDHPYGQKPQPSPADSLS